LSHLAQLLSRATNLLSEPDISHRFRSLGVSYFLTWLNISQYFESFLGFYYAFLTMSFPDAPVRFPIFGAPPLSMNGGFAIETVVTLARRSVDQLPAVTPSCADFGYGSRLHDGLA